MEKSESIKEITAALVKFQLKVEPVKKDATNPFFKSKYASLENVLETIDAPLTINGLKVAQFPDGDGLYTLIMHESGEWIGAHAKLELKGHTPQDQGSAITYMRRYALSAALGLATEDDDDGNAASKPSPAKVAAPSKIEAERTAKKKLIAEKLNKIALVPLETKEEYEECCEANTGLKLEPANYDEILVRLENINSIPE